MGQTELAEARRCALRMGASLPGSISVATLGVLKKAPFNLLSGRESLIWRTEELIRTACDALERTDLTAGAILSRAVMESAAIMWKLKELLFARHSHTEADFNDQLMRLMLGGKIWSEMPAPFQILTLIDRVARTIPNFRKGYDLLSEIAHPNWSGVVGMYSNTDDANYTTYFGRGLRDPGPTTHAIACALLGAGEIFEKAYNQIAEEMPVYLSELERMA
jgi:hypothetical protein